MHLTRFIVILALIASSSLYAQTVAPPQNVLQLSTTGTVEVTQDQIAITLSTAREGKDPVAIQNQLKAAVEAAMADARRSAEPGQMQVRTGNFAVHPKWGPNGVRDGWQGTAEIVLEGRDFPRIAQVAGRITSMTVANVSFSLSREQRTKVESEALLIAIERFKAKAGELAKAFGFGSYGLREVTVSSNDMVWPQPRPMAGAASMRAEAAPVPVEAGKTAVTVTVSGSVQLR